MSMFPERVETALRHTIATLDYDLHKSLECDEQTGEDTYDEVTNTFLEYFEEH